MEWATHWLTPQASRESLLVVFNDKIMEADFNSGEEDLQRLLWLLAQLRRLRCLPGPEVVECLWEHPL